MSEPDETANALRAALRRLPGPVALLTSCDPEDGTPAGMVASAVIPVSMEPPSMLVSINQNASMHRVITASGLFCINLLGTAQTGFVGLFSDPDRRARRFESADWRYAEGMPWLPDACANIFCQVRETLVFGTHELFIGEVIEVRGEAEGEPSPLGWIEGNFAQIGPLA